jgi:hypothetical protein
MLQLSNYNQNKSVGAKSDRTLVGYISGNMTFICVEPCEALFNPEPKNPPEPRLQYMFAIPAFFMITD